MIKNSMAYVTYWRNSLADAELGKGGLKETDIQNYDVCSKAELSSGVIAKVLVDQYFKAEKTHIQRVDVTIRPYVYAFRTQHGQYRKYDVPLFVTPIVSRCQLDRSGKLHPIPYTRVPRDILEPLDHGSFFTGDIDALDSFITKHGEFGEQASSVDKGSADELPWQRFIRYCDKMLEEVAPPSQWSTPEREFELKDSWYIVKNDGFTGSSQHILPLYDHMRRISPDVALFDTYAKETVSPAEKNLADNAEFSERLAHASDKFELAAAQRDALAHVLVMDRGDTLAVHGPPGTGKTTLILSTVATLWAKAALEGTEPPIIFAASTNNQAVTNIIDAFGKDFATGSEHFAGRWLPDVESFGSYFPSTSKEKEKVSPRKYHTKEFFENCESKNYLEGAETFFLEAARRVYPDFQEITIEKATELLQRDIKAQAKKLIDIEHSWRAYQQARRLLLEALGNAPLETLNSTKFEAACIKINLDEFQIFRIKRDDYRANESIWYSLFWWIKPVAEKRRRRALQFVRDICPPSLDFVKAQSLNHIDQMLDTRVQALESHRASLLDRIQYGERLIESERLAAKTWHDATAYLYPEGNSAPYTLADIDCRADTHIRFAIFLLTTHYWEGRWLLETHMYLKEISEKKRKTTIEPILIGNWRRRMKLTPCAVATLYMLPKEMKFFIDEKDGERNYGYLHEFIDLLIIDEAGQVLPEVAGASFALAKKALVIGDTQQLEPVWSMPRKVDIGNLISTEILPKENYTTKFEHLKSMGKIASSGSVMSMAQSLTRYHKDIALPRSLWLDEHRRCDDEIIGFCNALSYGGKLKPVRGHGQRPTGIPAMGYLHVDGRCEKSEGSRVNRLEAETIAAWISDHKAVLESFYAKPLQEIVAIVTPFRAQVAALKSTCKAKNIPVNAEEAVTIGTIHSLQGAERHIVIFSPVYSKHDDGKFIDQGKNMLNVAVSRAKDSFLVCGDMDTFNPADAGNPRGKLAAWLYKNPENELHYAPLKRADLVLKSKNVRLLQDTVEHDRFLLGLIESSQSEFIIVSPWIKIHQLKNTGIIPALCLARQRGVTVTVYTERQSCIDSDEAKVSQWIAIKNYFKNYDIKLVDVLGLHSKIAIGDNSTLCIGSYNWLSAMRRGQFAKHETSIVYSGDTAVAEEIDCIKKSLLKRQNK